MLLVFTPHITARLKFVFKQVCTRILGIEVNFTSKVEEFVAHDSIKMSYTNQQLGNEFHIKKHSILTEQGLSDTEIIVQEWEETKCFFYVGPKCSIPFDIFAASFFLLSRYEEYLPHLKDEYNRFPREESLAYKYDLLHQPVVDIWAYKFKAALALKYPNFQFSRRVYKLDVSIDVPTAFYFKHKGLMRTIGGTFWDIGTLRFRQLFNRYSVLLGFKKDPYDTFKWIINKQKQTPFKFNTFFLIGNYSTYDKNISINKKKFVSLIKSVADYCNVGLKVSYFAIEDVKTLKKEKQNLEEVINTSLIASRNSFSKLNLPYTYRNLIDLEINQDYSMGYINQLGFRAGTCTPFLFYDLDYEIQTPLEIHPYHVLDFALLKFNSQLDKKETLQRVIEEVKKVNGTLSVVFHNYSFSNEDRWIGFKELFSIILNSANED